MQALEPLAEAEEDLNKEGVSYDKPSELFQAAIGELDGAQQDEENAHEQLCNSRDRHDMGFMETLEIKVKDSRDRCDKDWQELQGAMLRVEEATRTAEGSHAQSTTKRSVIDTYQRCTRSPTTGSPRPA